LDLKSAELNVRHIACDLSKEQELLGGVAEVLAFLRDDAPEGEVVVINNAGFGGYGRFGELATDHQLGMVDLNIRAVVDLTRRLMPALRERGGAVINVASTAAFQPTPYLATYGASKAFVLHWSLALSEELRGTRVRALAVCPGPTATAFFKRAGMQGGAVNDAVGQTSEAVVQEAWAALLAGRSLVVTGWKNKVMTSLSGMVPITWAARIAAVILEKYRLKQAKA
tara:strand:- start:51 stop:728 length:678 start_codon:yes stop_codon:yes gene_type:complete